MTYETITYRKWNGEEYTIQIPREENGLEADWRTELIFRIGEDYYRVTDDEVLKKDNGWHTCYTQIDWSQAVLVGITRNVERSSGRCWSHFVTLHFFNENALDLPMKHKLDGYKEFNGYEYTPIDGGYGFTYGVKYESWYDSSD